MRQDGHWMDRGWTGGWTEDGQVDAQVEDGVFGQLSARRLVRLRCMAGSPQCSTGWEVHQFGRFDRGCKYHVNFPPV